MRKPIPNKDKEKKKIKIERRTGNHYSYYVDANGILKGRWGGHKKCDYGNGHELYYDRYRSYIPIDESGFFYNIFDCRKYDAVLLIDGGIYICEKNNKIGLIDSNENILINCVYESITTYKLSDLICLVKSKTGSFIYNVTDKKASKEYKELVLCYLKHNVLGDYIYYRNKNKRRFGVLDKKGNEILPDIYYLNRSTNQLHYIYDNYHYTVSIKGGLYYGIIPIHEFDNCFRVGTKDGCFYITEKNGKYGLLTNYIKLKVASEPFFDKIILDKSGKSLFENGYHKISKGDLLWKWGTVVFIIAKKGKKYWLFNGYNGTCLLDNCDLIIFIEKRRYSEYSKEPYIDFYKNRKHGFITSGGFIIYEDDYDEITFTRGGFIYITKDGKHGIITHLGSELIPCEYDFIDIIDQNYILVKKGDNVEKINLSEVSKSDTSIQNEEQHYSKYNDSYAQKVMGYSDEDIDSVLDGDPDAYWNID